MRKEPWSPVAGHGIFPDGPRWDFPGWSHGPKIVTYLYDFVCFYRVNLPKEIANLQ